MVSEIRRLRHTRRTVLATSQVLVLKLVFLAASGVAHAEGPEFQGGVPQLSPTFVVSVPRRHRGLLQPDAARVPEGARSER